MGTPYVLVLRPAGTGHSRPPLSFPRISELRGQPEKWLPGRDSNPNYLIQSQASYR